MTTASVLALPGSFSLTAKTLADANFNEKLNLLLSSKNRTKQQSQKTVDLAGYYIKVTCDLNAHVTKTLNGNNTGADTDVHGETGVADDMFEFEALSIADTDFSGNINPQNKYMSLATQQGTKANGKLWNNASAFSEYRLKHFESNFELGRITLKSDAVPGATISGTTQWAVKQSIETEELPGNDNDGFTAKNLLVMPAPTVNEIVGTGNLVASIEENVTEAQYLHLTATAGVDENGQATELNTAKQGTAFGNDSKYTTNGADNSWVATADQADIDQLEDKLGLNVSAAEIAAAYADQIAAVKTATSDLTNKKIITEWSVSIPRIGGASSLFSQHARAIYNTRGGTDDKTGTPNLFRSEDKIVIVHPDNVEETNRIKPGEPITHDLVLTVKDYAGVTRTLVDHSKQFNGQNDLIKDDALRFILEQA